MTYRPTKTAFRELVALANGQAGYFTAKQAAAVGYGYPHLDYHVRAGNFERVGHGLYRLPIIPPGEHDDLVRLALWSRDRNDRPQAVASHETALAVHELSDILPSKSHVTVPNSFRKPAPRGTVLHRRAQNCADVENRDGFLVTSPLRTILDVADDDRISEEHLEKALAEALQRGLVSRSRLKGIVKTLPAASRLSRSLAALR